MKTFTRARQPEQKEERRARLLATARAMLDEGAGLGDVSLSELARRAAMTKSNVYRYFESREAVLLALLVEEWVAWFLALKRGWRRPPPGASGDAALEHLARHLARTLAARPRLCLLTSAVPQVLEQNLSEAAIREFKLLSLAHFEAVAAFMTARAPRLTGAAAVTLLYDAVAAITGLYPATHPSAAAARALDDPALCGLRRDFARELERFVCALARDVVRRGARA
jgi:AcrR family transcriptional regulator